jgi:indolepyruvate ferredoxin oxidoreductase
MVINERICEGCGDCGLESNCVAIKPLETLFGTKRKIDQTSCNKDFSCKNGFCPSFVMLEGVDGQDPLKPQNQLSVSLPEEVLPTPPVFAGDPTRILVTGIGGSGVVTVGAVLSVAARLEGKHALSLDQTGLSQKNGAVASNLTIGSREIRHHPSKIGQGAADLLIACDLLGGVSDETLKALHAEKARVVANTRVEPLPHFARDPEARPQGDLLMSRLTAVVPDHHVTTAATSDLAEALVGDGMGANMMLVGFAAQQGFLPVSVEAIQQAIRLNAVAVEMNLAAFTWGRWLVADPARVHTAASPHLTPAFEQPSTSDLIDKHYRELTDYQNRALANVYREAVTCIDDEHLRRVAANSLFKALAYKDEYEVARLMLAQPNMGAKVTGRVRRFYYLAPPIFGARDADTGTPKKFKMPGWAIEPVFRLLCSLKWLRGGPLDVFGFNQERKNERALAADCLAMVRAIGDRGATVDREAATQDLNLVLEVKGFGHVKQRNWRQVEQRWQEARQRWSV